MKKNFFTCHFKETGENYFEHFLYSFIMAMWIFVVSVMLLIHTIFPFLFPNSSIKNIKKINEVMEKKSYKLACDKNNKKDV